MEFDLVVRGDAGDVAVADGVIAALGPDLPGGSVEIDARGREVLPGVVDAHVHLNDPGRADWEGWSSGTLALAAGGATCCVDMPLNSHPPTLDGASFDAKVAAARGAARVDFALWGGLVPGPLDRLDELAARGAIGVKAFMCPSGIDDFPAADDDVLAAGMARAARLGLPVAVHAEDAALTGALAARAVAEGRTGMRDFLASRPAEAELTAIARALAIAGETGCALHVVHVSTGRGVRLVAEARARGIDATCETCPHYLVLDSEDAEALGAVAKCAPPLRPPSDREDLGRELASGAVDWLASDHSPGPPALKAGADMFAAWGGIAGAQTLLALALTHDPGLDAAVLLAARPADRLRLSGKGRLEVGADADLVLVDRSRPWRLRAEDLRQRHPLSPFVGRELRARAVRTIVRGRTAWPPEGPPAGRLVTPRPTEKSMLAR